MRILLKHCRGHPPKQLLAPGGEYDELLESAHIDLESLSKQSVRMPELSALVAREYLTTRDTSKLIDSSAIGASGPNKAIL